MDYTRRDLLALMGTAGALGRYGDAAAQDTAANPALPAVPPSRSFPETASTSRGSRRSIGHWSSNVRVVHFFTAMPLTAVHMNSTN